jgi:hypothetical protein
MEFDNKQTTNPQDIAKSCRGFPYKRNRHFPDTARRRDSCKVKQVRAMGEANMKHRVETPAQDNLLGVWILLMVAAAAASVLLWLLR